MTRDPALEARMAQDFADLVAAAGDLGGKPMFGGWCFLLRGHMLAAARAGRAIFRVGVAAQDDALALPHTGPMSLAGRPKPGYVWLSEPALSDESVRRRLALMACAHVSDLPPKDA